MHCLATVLGYNFCVGQKERHQRLRRKVILEFVDTEETYLGDLLLIVSKLLNPLRAGKSAQVQQVSVPLFAVQMGSENRAS